MNCDVTNSRHQMQMTTICHWIQPPWEFSAYATAWFIRYKHYIIAWAQPLF